MSEDKKPEPLIKYVKVSAKYGISVPAWAIVQSAGFKKNLKAVKRIFEKKKELEEIEEKLKKLEARKQKLQCDWIRVDFRKPKAREHIIVWSKSLQKKMYGKLVQSKNEIGFEGTEFYRLTDGWQPNRENQIDVPIDDVDIYLRKPSEPTNGNDNGIWLKGDGSNTKDNLIFVFRTHEDNGDYVAVKSMHSKYQGEMDFNDYYFYWGIVCGTSEITHYAPIPDPPTV